MSADNWAPCPECEPGVPDEGQMSNSLREDWGLGILLGEFYVRYRAACRDCSFRYEFDTSLQVPIAPWRPPWSPSG